ncbi:MAG: MarR family transcriptional regulator [Pseudomonadota bacterium]
MRRRRSSGWSSSYSGYPRYVPVAERRAQAERAVRKLAKGGRVLQPVLIEGRTIARTFWGKAWCHNLEAYSDYANRLPRGRTYARNGSVLDLRIGPGVVEALVAGSQATPYTVRIGIAPLPAAHWARIRAACAGRIGSLVELLSGQLSSGVMEVVSRKGEGLFPSPREIELRCSCPDWATMCKHVAATLYGVGARLDREPALLFTLRGVDPTELVEEAIAQTTASAAPTSAPTLDSDDLSSIFGIDLALEGEPPVEAPTRAKPSAEPKARTTRAAKAAAKPPAQKKKATAKPAAAKPPTAKPAARPPAAAKKKATAAREPPDLPPAARRLLEIIRAEPGLRSPALCARLGVSGSTVNKHVGILREHGLVRFVGAKTNGGYYAEEE